MVTRSTGVTARKSSPHDDAIASAIEQVAQEDIPWISFGTATQIKRIVELGAEFYRSYLDAVLDNAPYKSDRHTACTSIAYSAMRGVGATPAETLLAEAGFNQIYSVTSQREPDGQFPALPFPNPEEPGLWMPLWP